MDENPRSLREGLNVIGRAGKPPKAIAAVARGRNCMPSRRAGLGGGGAAGSDVRQEKHRIERLCTLPAHEALPSG